jgi:hypothetical protein
MLKALPMSDSLQMHKEMSFDLFPPRFPKAMSQKYQTIP